MLQPKTHFTVAEYLAMEAVSETKNEYWDGLIVPVYPEVKGEPGAGLRHALLVSRFAAVFTQPFSDCEAVTSNLRTGIGGGKYLYPDVVVICGKPELSGENPPSLLNPVFIVEVVSPSTEHVDPADKRDAYLQIPSLQEYWIARQDAPFVTRYVRTGDEWRLRIESGADTMFRVDALGADIAFAEIYRD